MAEAAGSGKEEFMDTTACRCMGCGAPLPIEHEQDGVVCCEYCGTKNYVEGLEDDTPVYSAPAKSGKELIGRFLDLKKDKQDNIMMHIFMVVIFGGMILALIVGALTGAA